jgi:hypothetical protein
MYRRPILWTLYNALDFLKVLKIAVVVGGGGGGVNCTKCIYYFPVDDGWDQVLGRNVYIMSQLMMAGIKYWDVMYTLRPSTGT